MPLVGGSDSGAVIVMQWCSDSDAVLIHKCLIMFLYVYDYIWNTVFRTVERRIF